MALTKVGRGLLNTSIVDNGNATAITIDSSENVGIGISPSYQLDVYETAAAFAAKIKNYNGSDAGGGLWIDTRWNTAANRPLKITSNNEGTSLFEVTGTGNVGIGNSAPASIVGGTATSAVLTVGGGDGSLVTGDRAGSISFKSDDASYKNTFPDGITGEIASVCESGVGSSYGMSFYTGTVTGSNREERMRITCAGNVGIGTSLPNVNLEILSGGTFTGAIRVGDSGSSRRLILEQTDVLTYTIGGTGTSSVTRFVSGGSSGIGTERMRINAGGQLLIGTTTGVTTGTLATSGLEVVAPPSQDCIATQVVSAGATCFGASGPTGGGGVYLFGQMINASGSQVGSISVSHSATAYNTSSDYRLKEDDVPMTGATERVKALRPINFAWKVDGSRTDGFFAHEAQEVVPECSTGTKDAMMDEEYEVTPAVEEVRDEDGNVTTEAVAAVMGTRSVPDYQGIDQSKLVPLLTATIQELIARIEALEGA